MPFGLLTGLGAALAWGTMDVGSALAGRRVGSLAVTAGGQLVSGVVLLGLLSMSGQSLPGDPRAVALAAFVGLVGARAYVAYFAGLRVGPISVVSGKVAAYGGLTVLLAVIVRAETLTTVQAIGAAVATLGVAMTGVAFDVGLEQAPTSLVGLASARRSRFSRPSRSSASVFARSSGWDWPGSRSVSSRSRCPEATRPVRASERTPMPAG
jgi:uncharacterized membrane protein